MHKREINVRINVWNKKSYNRPEPSYIPFRLNTRGVRTQVFSSPTSVLIQEVEILILIRILFATQIWNPNPEKILLIYLTNQCATIKNVCF